MIVDWSYDYQGNSTCQQITPKQQQTDNKKFILKMHLFAVAKTNIYIYIYIYISIHAQSCFHLIYVSHMEKHMHMHTLAHSYTLNDIHTLMVVLKGHCIESLAYSCAWAGQDKISVQRLVKIQTHKRLRITLFIRTKHNMQIFRVSPLLSYKMTLKQQTVKNNEKWDGQLIHLSFLGWAMSSPETVSLKGW